MGGKSLQLEFHLTSMNTNVYHNQTQSVIVNARVHRSTSTFARELGALRTLSGGPGIPKLVREINPQCLIVLTESKGISWPLSFLLETHRSLNETVISGIAFRALKIIRHAHGQGVLHNNISAENIIVSESFDIEVVNWGSSTSFIDPITTRHIKLASGHDQRFWPSRRDDYIDLMETLFYAQTRLSIYTEAENLAIHSPFRRMLDSANRLRYSERPPYEGTMSDFQWYHNTITTHSDARNVRKPFDIFL